MAPFFRYWRNRATVVNQVADSQYRMMQKHSRTSPAHDGFDFFSLLRLIAVDRALLTGGLLRTEAAFFQTPEGILIKPLVAIGVFLLGWIRSGVKLNHFFNRFGFALKTFIHGRVFPFVLTSESDDNLNCVRGKE